MRTNSQTGIAGRLLLLVVALAATLLLLAFPERVFELQAVAAIAAIVPIWLIVRGADRLRSCLVLLFLLLLLIVPSLLPPGVPERGARRAGSDEEDQTWVASAIVSEGEKLASLATELATDPVVLEGFREPWTRSSRREVFETLEREGEKMPPRWISWGVAIEIGSASVGNGTPLAWWGEIPELEEVRRPTSIQILGDPAHLHLVAEAPVELSEEGDTQLLGRVRVMLPVAANPSEGGAFGSTPPFGEWLNRSLGREVVIFTSGSGRGKAIRLSDGGAVGRVHIHEVGLGEKRAVWKTRGGGACRVLLLIFWVTFLPWKVAAADRNQIKSLRAMVGCIPVRSVLLLRLILLLFSYPGYFAATGTSPGLEPPGFFILLSIVHSPAEGLLSCVALLLVILILRERLAAGRSEKTGRAPLRLPGLAVVLGFLSAVTVLFWKSLSLIIQASSADLFSGPAYSGSLTIYLVELSLFLMIASYLLLVDAGFVWATRFGLIGEGVASRLSFPVRFLLSSLFGFTTIILSALAISRGWLVVLSPAVAITTGLLLLFLLRGRGWRLWNGLGFITAAALVAYSPIRIAQSDMERSEVEERALRFADPRDETKRGILEEALQFFMEDAKLIGMLSIPHSDLNERSAFYAWIRSGLSQHDYSCDLKILNHQGAVVSRFSMDMPADSPARAAFVFRELRSAKEMKIQEGRRRVRGETVDIYTGAAPIIVDGELLGAVIVSMPYFIESLEYASKFPGASSEIFRNYRTVETSLTRFPEEVQVLLYNGDSPVRSSSDQPPPLPPPDDGFLAELGRTGSEWKNLSAGNRPYSVFYTPWKDPSREGVLAFAIPKWSLTHHTFKLIDTILTCLFHSAILLALLLPTVLMVSYFHSPRFPIMAEFTFQDRLVLAFLLIALLPAVLLGGAGRRMVKNYAREAGENEARTSLQTVRFALEQETIREAEELARSTFVRRRILEVEEVGLVDLELGLKRFGIFSPRGELILQNGRIGAIDREALQEVRERRIPVAYFEGVDQLSIIALVGIVIEGQEDELEGILLLAKPIDEPLTVELGERVGKDLTFFKGGDLTATTRAELFQAGILASRLPSKIYYHLELIGEKIRFGNQLIAETPYLVGYGVLPNFRGEPVGTLAVPLLFREQEASRDIARAYAAITYLTFLTLVVIVVIAELMGQSIARPVAELTRGMARLRSGKLDFTILRKAGGEIGRLVDSFNQTTRELKRSRDALTERSRFIETILRSVGAGVIAFDRSDRIASLNPAAGRFLDLTLDPAEPQRMEELSGERIDAFLKVLADLDRTGEGLLEREIELPGEDGKITLRVVGSLLTDHDGNHLGKVVVFEDLTTLIQSKKLLAWGEMARQVAHEIKNPLTPIKLSAQQIRRAYHDKHARFEQILNESTDLIIEEIESLRKIATEFSAFARMPRRKIEGIEPVHMLREVARLYEESLGEGRIVADLPEKLPEINVDREEVRRVLINLFENAVQAAGGGGEIRLSAEIADGPPANDAGWDLWESTPEKPAPGPLLVIRIRDNGRGVSDAARGKLFEPNFSTKTDGTGLGLAISRSIVEGYHGSIIIGSTAGGGSEAIVSLPV